MNSPILRKNLVSLIPDNEHETHEKGYNRGRGKVDSHVTVGEGGNSRGQVGPELVSGSPSEGLPDKPGDSILD